MRRGFLLIDALIGMALLGLLLSGLHQLRSVQMRGSKSARARLSATETAAAAALMTGLDLQGDRRALLERLRPANASVGPIELTTAPLPGGLKRVIARAPWRAGTSHGFEEVSAVAP